MPAFLILFAILVALLATTLVLVVVAIVRRKTFAKTFAILAAVLVITFLLLYDQSFVPMFDDGPFRGRPCTRVPSSHPDQEVRLHGGRFLVQTWDRNGRDSAPIVTLREHGTVRWCIYAEAYPQTRVERLRFRSRRPIIWRDVIDASVQWTYGEERALWFIARDGTLKEYWYSW